MKAFFFLSSLVLVGLAFGCAVDPAAPEDLATDDEVGAAQEALTTCGGIAGLPCPTGYVCADDPRDACDPRAGGADCGGVCKRSSGGSRCDYTNPNRTYYGTSTEECSLIRFACAEGWSYFSDACGCGCETSSCTSIGLCTVGYTWDPVRCRCTRDRTSVSCGSKTCRNGQVCCNSSCGICTDPGDFCIQLACL